MRLARFLPLAALALLTACGTRPPADPNAINDPFEPTNRQIHAFNVGLDSNLIRPLTGGGGDKEKPPADGGSSPAASGSGLDILANIGGNLSLPGKVLNNILQGRPKPALQNTARFVVNSTLGLGGLLDPAGPEFALTEVDTDFGETLHVWGIPEGAYVELPVLGPSTSRDAVGRVVDIVIDPWGNWLNRDEWYGTLAVRAISKAGERARFGDTVDSVLHESADSYAQTRLLYLMHRRYELAKGGASDDPSIIDPYETDGAASSDDGFIDPYAQ